MRLCISHYPFLPTPSARRATRTDNPIIFRGTIFLPTPSARRATSLFGFDGDITDISTHALREEGDLFFLTTNSQNLNFYPRPPRGGRHAHASPEMQRLMISTHALREEGDGVNIPANTFPTSDFYPRPPRGGRQFKLDVERFKFEFLPTPSARRATRALQELFPYMSISTHALREEGDDLNIN